MPRSSDELREKFMDFENGDDGIGKAEDIIKKSGMSMESFGLIEADKDVDYNDEVWDAVDYLCDEWDFSFIYKKKK